MGYRLPEEGVDVDTETVQGVRVRRRVHGKERRHAGITGGERYVEYAVSHRTRVPQYVVTAVVAIQCIRRAITGTTAAADGLGGRPPTPGAGERDLCGRYVRVPLESAPGVRVSGGRLGVGGGLGEEGGGAEEGGH